MTILKNRLARLGASFTGLAFVLGLSACAQKHSHMPPDEYMNESRNNDIVRQLEAAKELDESNAMQQKLGTVARQDYLDQAGKADRAIKELTHGYPVSEAELHDALSIPPGDLSAEQKSALISRIEQAKAATDHNEQEMIIATTWTPDWNPETSRFDEQKKLDDQVIEDLTIGEPVYFDTIQHALQVVQNPY
jgi:hypothetical protein